MIADLSGGVEPLFKVAYVKKNVLGGSEFRYINPLLLEALKNHGLDSNKELVDEILAKGTVHQLKDKLPEDIVRVFRTAESISPEWHVRVQAEFQKYVDNAISKVCFFIIFALPNIFFKTDVQFSRGCHHPGRHQRLH